MKPPVAAKIVIDAFRGMRCRLDRDGLLDLIVGRMTNVLVDEVGKETERCAVMVEMEDLSLGDLAAEIRSGNH